MNETLDQPGNVDLLEDIVKPPIYSNKAIWIFSFIFSPLFGGILLVQNLKDIGKKREANKVLLVSILMTVSIVFIIAAIPFKSSSISFVCNLAGAAVLSRYFYKKYFPDEIDYEKKKIWKPLIIGIVLCVVVVLFQFWAQDQLVK